MTRNAPCPCGSGKRFKHCCGLEGRQRAHPTRSEALAAHRAGSLRLAETLYRRALEENPGDIDVLHMLGVVQLERFRYHDALELILKAAERSGWAQAQIRHNLGLVLAKLLVRRGSVRQPSLVEMFLAWEQAHSAARTDITPMVSVIMPAFNQARFTSGAIASVAAQIYTNLELIVIDDGSTDGSAELIARQLEGLSVPTRFIARGHRGAPASLNEAASLAGGAYLSFLNADECYAPDRVAAMVDGVARAGLPWGFSLVAEVVAGEAEAAAGEPAPAGVHWQLQQGLLGGDSNSFALAQSNVAVSTGNLFVERQFFLSLDGFRERYLDHGWDFSLRAAALAEPVVVRRPLYFHRPRDAASIGEPPARAAAEADQVLGDFIATTLAGTSPCANPLAPQWPENRTLFLARILAAGKGALVPVPALRDLAHAFRDEAPGEEPRETANAARVATRRAAVVVLGMHRSGTSALARVLNLCGAFLPANLMPPKLHTNPTGFWEPEAVVSLNERMLRRLGGAWHRVGFALPEGEVADEFVHDIGALLASEYGNQPTILIKDPRIGALAPLWHRALTEAGYRAVYVVPLRDPIEVARSLEARGDMTVSEGLALWHAYMSRIEAFTESVPSGATHLQFTDLFDDWRGAVRRVAARLDLTLDVETRAGEVDRFLEPSLRRQRSDQAALETLPADAVNDEVRSRYATLVARCERDADATVTRADASPG